MKLTGNTILITGGGSGIGRGLAEAFHKLGNQVIISGRRKGHLADTTKANPGMQSVEIDVQDPTNIAAVAKKLIHDYPEVNVLINNAGIMQPDNAGGVVDEAVLVPTITTNLLGPIRMTSAFIEHLKKQESAVVMQVSSGLAFVPLAMASIYSSTKAALHSYSLSMRYKLKGTSVKVLELAPPWVRTDIMNSKEAVQAMPFDEFIAETMKILATDAEEIVVERAKMLRNNPGPAEGAFVNQFNDMVAQIQH
jgi:uncharacterized oxidoreductase